MVWGCDTSPANQQTKTATQPTKQGERYCLRMTISKAHNKLIAFYFFSVLKPGARSIDADFRNQTRY